MHLEKDKKEQIRKKMKPVESWFGCWLFWFMYCFFLTLCLYFLYDLFFCFGNLIFSPVFSPFIPSPLRILSLFPYTQFLDNATFIYLFVYLLLYSYVFLFGILLKCIISLLSIYLFVYFTFLLNALVFVFSLEMISAAWVNGIC